MPKPAAGMRALTAGKGNMISLVGRGCGSKSSGTAGVPVILP